MSGIIVPEDRVLSQPVTGFCRNPRCREKSNQEFRFKVEHDLFSCPKCGANSAPMVGVMTLTHMLVPDPDGPVRGNGGVRYVIACDSKRAYLATVSNDEAVTDNPKVANCPGCLAKAESLLLIHPKGMSLIEKAKRQQVSQDQLLAAADRLPEVPDDNDDEGDY
ncbi:hypothetical protein Pla52o_35100 [Novipirellula galeiformis]|uniref:Uncharacterized protein n=1 Tax=Novipirellula galeiformis TaxID=2528004 RepID=A0A5C6CFY4_9BACT|nr:hypothetical protein [Novipirellula galeiformis]TWU22454.1 hypothetical protein Pla52o_35100 [Novipirellula galeiformis]